MTTGLIKEPTIVLLSARCFAKCLVSNAKKKTLGKEAKNTRQRSFSLPCVFFYSAKSFSCRVFFLTLGK